MKRLVVVESPTKARTIKNYLSGDYTIKASMGHVRDLPASSSEIPAAVKKEDWSRLGVNVDEGFEPIYIVPSDKRDVVKELRAELKTADELYIATDEDREGESIGWHLIKVLEPEIPVRRMVFHEITREAIQRALEETREIDTHLVDAQEARRILDRLVGYEISPLLWRKIAPKLSAGRVQSVAVRILVNRERERIVFVPASYWDLQAELAADGAPFDASMTHFRSVPLASGKDFDDETGRLKEGLTGLTGTEDEAPDDPTGMRMLLSEEKAKELAAQLPSSTWEVTNVEQRVRTSKPYPPFITSTLQQEASRKLGFAAGRTMRAAQRLYENGHITYMRTDSTNLSKEAIGAARQSVENLYGKKYLSDSPRQYSGKVRNAQEAHEAIRPAGTAMKTASQLRLSGDERKLYDLIWKRTVATQMANAKQRFTTVHIEAGEGIDIARFRASGKEIIFPGFFRAYVEGSDDPEAKLEDRERPLPGLEEGDQPECKSVEANGHETKPPSRYTEAGLIKVLEEEGIGRPSTYASIIDTITRRGYVRKNGRQLVATFTGFAVTQLLEKQFEQLVDTGFTASMEETLDDIAAGDLKMEPYLKSFYFSEGDGLKERVESGIEGIDPRQISTISYPQVWGDYVVRVGRYGPYAEGELDGETVTASLPEEVDPGDVREETLRELLERSNKGDKVLGIHPEHDMPVLLKDGPYGHYVQLGEDDQEGKPKRQSLRNSDEPETLDFETAVKLLALPRTLGEHPEDGKEVTASIGRYGPYVKHKSTYASIPKSEDVLSIELDRGLELLKKKKKKGREPLRELGEHPRLGGDINLFDGRYGPYVKHKRTNASLGKEMDPEKITLEQAVELIDKKRSKKGKKKGRKKRK